MPFLSSFIGTLVFLLWLLVFGRVLLSWFDPGGRTQVGRLLYQATEPLLAPVRRLLPSTGMFDFSPLIVLLLLGFVMRMVGFP
jgi:YggT family protein